MSDFAIATPTAKAIKDAYIAMKGGYLFAVTHQTPGTAITGQTSFVATTPTFLLYSSGAARRTVGFEMWLSQAGTVAGGTIEVVVALDSVSRFSTGGTAITPLNCNMESSVAAVSTFAYNPTAISATATVRYLWAFTVAASLGTVSNIDFEDGIGIGATGSILIYTWAATTGPTWRLGARWKEET